MSQGGDRKSTSITRDLMLGLLGTILFVSFIAISLTYSLSRQQVAAEVQEKTEDLVASISQSFSTPLWYIDEQSVRSIGVSFKQVEFLSSLEIKDIQGNSNFKFERMTADRTITESGEIYKDGEQVGSFNLSISRDYFASKNTSFLIQSVLIIVANLIAILVITRLLVRRLITERIRVFSNLVSRIGTSGYELPSDIKPIKEFSLFVDVLNQMAQKIKSQISDIQFEKSRAEDANKAKSVFLANMSHEIRTSMNGVVGMAEILSRTNLQPEQQKMLSTIQSSSDSLLRIIDDILDLSKIEAGKMSVEVESVRLEEIFEQVIDTIGPMADERNVRLCLDLDTSLPAFIRADAVRLRQVLMNLMSNATKFSASKDIGVRGEVFLIARLLDGNRISISIQDNGIGMSQDVLNRIFKPFTQGEESTVRVYGGTGLGLVISDNLVRLMGGEISVESSPGKGATFTVTLPFEDAEGEIDEPDISDLHLFGLAEREGLRNVLTNYANGSSASIQFASDEAELKSLISSSEGPVIVLLGMETREESKRVRKSVGAIGERVKFLNFTHDRDEIHSCDLPSCYTVQCYPVRPSEMRHGLAVLAGRVGSGFEQDELRPKNNGSGSEEQESRLILLVEDNMINQKVICTQLEMLGHSVEVAENGVQGLDKWKTGRFDLVLSDCQMPVMDGFEMTRKIREQEESSGEKRIPIVAITANALKGEAEKCSDAGMDDFLSKPVALLGLKASLDRWF